MSIERKINDILNRIIDMQERLDAMATTAVTRDQFDAALTDAVTKITTALTDLEEKIKAGNVVTPADFSSELATLKGIVSTAVSADPGAPAPSPVPVAPPPV